MIMKQIGFDMLKLAFFDIDGTLIRRDFSSGTLSLKSRAFNNAVKQVFGLEGFDYTRILGKRIFGLTDRSIIKITLAQIGISSESYHSKEDELFLAIDDYFECHLRDEKASGYYALPGIFDFLSKLKADDIRLGLVTGNIKKHADWKLAICGFDGIFTTGGFGDDAELRSDILRTGIARNNDIAAKYICHFGDSPPDIIAARECGIKVIALSDKGGGTHSRDELQEIGYGLIIDSWKDWEIMADYLARN
jgi:phosphoglycolate phosphatase